MLKTRVRLVFILALVNTRVTIAPDMKISDFDYTLPDDRIAQHPPKVRGQSKLLVLSRESGVIEDRSYNDMVDYLAAGDVVVLNDTKVIKARIIATNKDGKPRELLLIENHGVASPHERKAIYRGKLHNGEVLDVNGVKIRVNQVLEGGLVEISSAEDLLALAEKTGSVPLPPYMKREATTEDTERYQTVFAREAGSVAAPTASLNFTEELEDKLTAKGVKIAYLTLHVGLGTFLPIRTDDIEDHQMHSEYFEIPKDTVAAIKNAKNQGKRICAVGTTVTRTLEYTAPHILDETPEDLVGEADIFMYPGYEFKLVSTLLTNFHAPRTTVLMLAAAFAGWDHLLNAYEHALKHNYQFLSYGDSMLIY